MPNNFSLRIAISQERKPYSVVAGFVTSTRFQVKTRITDIYVVDPLGAQGSVTLDKELFYASVPDLQIYDFVSGALRQYSGGTVVTPDVTISAVVPSAVLDDATISGAYSGETSLEYIVAVDTTGAQDTFQWSKGGTVQASGIPIVSGESIYFGDGFYVTFAAATGHTVGDKWTFTAYPLNVSTFTGSTPAEDDVVLGTDYTATDPKQFVVEVETVVGDAIVAFSDNGSGKLRVQVAGTGSLSTTDIVYITGSTAYSGYGWPITVVDPTHFDIDTTYVAEAIVAQAYEKVNTYRWSDDGGATWEATGVRMTTAAYELSDGFTVHFESLTGHTGTDRWIIPKFLSDDDQGLLINTADYIRFADVTDYSGTIDDAETLSAFYTANRFVLTPSTGTGIPDRYQMVVYDEDDTDGVPFTGEMDYPDKFRTSVFVADFPSLDAAVRHAEHVRNIINVFTKEYNALMNASFSTYEGDFPTDEEIYTFPQY